MKFTTQLLAFLTAFSPLSVVSQTRGGLEQSITPRHLSYERIAGYEPSSQVTDHNAIDRDQAVIEKYVATHSQGSFTVAQAVYEGGGNSKSYAILTLDSNLSASVSKGDEIKLVPGQGEAEVLGKAFVSAATGSNKVQVQYNTFDVQEHNLSCRVGALPEGERDFRGCFPNSGTLSIGGNSYTYHYDQLTENKNARTIRGFSLKAEGYMYSGCVGCPFPEYVKYYNYYGQHDYADNWITAAFKGEPTTTNNFGADFSTYTYVGRGEAVQKGTVFLAIYMYVIREFYDAIGDCKNNCIDCNDNSAHAWDEGVAFYSGSIEGTNGIADGKLLHQLADKRCINFKTCGPTGGTNFGISKVNYDLFAEFAQGQFNLLQGNCAGAMTNLDKILTLMPIPLIQGTLRYAYKTDMTYVKAHGREEKSMAEGAAFAAAVLPVLHACSADAAKTVANNMKVGATSTDFKAVKAAFESQYECMKISCTDIGGIYDIALRDYLPDATPCIDKVVPSDESSMDKKLALGLGVTAAAVGVFAIASIMYMALRERKGNPVFNTRASTDLNGMN